MSLQLPSAEVKDQLVHPCQTAQRSLHEVEHRQRLHQIRATRGWSSAAQTSIEAAMLSRPTRLGGLKSSNVLYRSFNNQLTDMDVFDVYGLPQNNPNVQPSARALMEKDVFGEELKAAQVRVGTF